MNKDRTLGSALCQESSPSIRPQTLAQEQIYSTQTIRIEEDGDSLNPETKMGSIPATVSNTNQAAMWTLEGIVQSNAPAAIPDTKTGSWAHPESQKENWPVSALNQPWVEPSEMDHLTFATDDIPWEIRNNPFFQSARKYLAQTTEYLYPPELLNLSDAAYHAILTEKLGPKQWGLLPGEGNNATEIKRKLQAFLCWRKRIGGNYKLFLEKKLSDREIASLNKTFQRYAATILLTEPRSLLAFVTKFWFYQYNFPSFEHVSDTLWEELTPTEFDAAIQMSWFSRLYTVYDRLGNNDYGITNYAWATIIRDLKKREDSFYTGMFRSRGFEIHLELLLSYIEKLIQFCSERLFFPSGFPNTHSDRKQIVTEMIIQALSLLQEHIDKIEGGHFIGETHSPEYVQYMRYMFDRSKKQFIRALDLYIKEELERGTIFAGDNIPGLMRLLQEDNISDSYVAWYRMIEESLLRYMKQPDSLPIPERVLELFPIVSRPR